MPIDFPIDAAFSALRTVVRTTWAIPNNTPIPETGDDPVIPSLLPMAILQVEDAVEVSIGPAARMRTTKIPLKLWLLREKTAGTRDIVGMRTALAALGTALYADMHLSGTVTTLEVTALNWSGQGGDPPLELPDSDEGALSGFVALTLEISENF